MTLHLGNLTVDCDDTLRVAAFWSAALDRPIDDEPSEHFASIGRDGGGDGGAQPGWFFIKVPEGKAVKNRVHVDLHADDREAEVARLVGLGATRLSDHDEWGATWTTLADPEGNEFCVAGSVPG
jgi:predicted enzyme related to lactoylglutathione lyase